jgi:hypothetical protein
MSRRPSAAAAQRAIGRAQRACQRVDLQPISRNLHAREDFLKDFLNPREMVSMKPSIKTNPKTFIRNSMLAALSLLLIGATKQGCQNTQPSPPPTQKVSALKPSLTPLPETKPSQDKGGVEISVAPVVYTVVDGTKVTDRTLYDRVKRDYDLSGRVFETPVRIIERTTTPVPKIQPDRLKFQVKVVNKMPRVFRGQGMVVQFNVAGKLHNVSPSGYADWCR